MFNLTRVFNGFTKGARPETFLVVASYYYQQSNIFKVDSEIPVLKSLKTESTDLTWNPAPYNLKPRPSLAFKESYSVADAIKVTQTGINALKSFYRLTEEEKDEVRRMQKELDEVIFNSTRVFNGFTKGARPETFLVVASSYYQQSNIFKVDSETPLLKSLKTESTDLTWNPAPYNLKPRPSLAFEESHSVADALKVTQTGINALKSFNRLTEKEKDKVRRMRKELDEV